MDATLDAANRHMSRWFGMKPPNQLKALIAALALSLIAACGQGVQAADPVNAEDVMFVQMMVQHHRQGIEIAKVGETKATTPELKIMAGAIAVTQQSEVEMMLRWLHSWGQPMSAPTGAHDHHGGMPETDRKQIQSLKKSKSFERDFMNLLIAHQDDARQMAASEVYSGANPSVKQWAAQVQSSRKAQIDQLLDLLKR
ncbi:DUF305 domain-containing protein [Nonomuraea sp. NN258]|uniref:DUF305 domain-containing protein n=1 Tax=Nonomuraea antri TaxID=2730852 RepID=UPI001568F97A|nr:DUF305 domain-containing protein [Nonomuraea antri]NRQ36435.1 DUF305 domain-containing protein [Nonomuraea antri]